MVSNPDGGDQRSTADDHIRLVKSAIKRTFPSIATAVSVSAGALNALPAMLVGQVTAAGYEISASYATSAQHAADATSAVVAYAATNSTNANSAAYAFSATNATSAKYATSAREAVSAQTALEASNSLSLGGTAASKFIYHVGSYTSGRMTVSTGAAAGGADGDLWLKIT